MRNMGSANFDYHFLKYSHEVRLQLMPKNKIQFQPGYSLIELFEDYGTEEKCEKALFDWKWPNGFSCPHCRHEKHCKLKQRKIYQCNKPKKISCPSTLVI